MSGESACTSVALAFNSIRWRTAQGGKTIAEIFAPAQDCTIIIESRKVLWCFYLSYMSVSARKRKRIPLEPASEQDLSNLMKLCLNILRKDHRTVEVDIFLESTTNKVFCYTPLRSFDPPDLIVDDLEKDKDEWLTPILTASKLRCAI